MFRPLPITLIVPLLISALTPTSASAQAIFFHTDGAPGDRQAYYSQPLVMDRTPGDMLMGPTEIKQIDVTVIHESPRKPEWTEMRLQFECPSLLAQAAANKSKKGQAALAPATGPVRMRVGEGSYILRRIDLKAEDMAAGAWTTSGDPAMIKARNLACNGPEIQRSMTAAYQNGHFDMADFNTRIRPFGLTEGVVVLAESTDTEFLELSWNKLWKGAVRPNPSGKWTEPVTDASRAAAMAKMAVVTKQLDALSAQLHGKYDQSIKKMQVGFAFDEQAAALRGGRKFNRAEASLIKVWQGKLERDVVGAMGAPHVTDNGDLRILSFGQAFDNRVIVESVASGASWEEGIYMNCNVDYILIPDSERALRVADVRVAVDSNNLASSSNACSGILNVPGG